MFVIIETPRTNNKWFSLEFYVAFPRESLLKYLIAGKTRFGVMIASFRNRRPFGAIGDDLTFGAVETK